jgi:hypothetical protein
VAVTPDLSDPHVRHRLERAAGVHTDRGPTWPGLLALAAFVGAMTLCDDDDGLYPGWAEHIVPIIGLVALGITLFVAWLASIERARARRARAVADLLAREKPSP